ncbi:MAG: molybdopterin biosynthesis protein, partial [Alphaproteobacteria bacterium]|nr:molybdopterin biosynthesis protein [Alphaproteobacteria bacterium]
MRFGPVPVADALGAILAHREVAGDLVLSKGHVLTGSDLTALASAGYTQITVAQLDTGDVGEDIAAAVLAAALVGAAPGLRLGTAATGRVNVIADTPGLSALDAAALHALNRINPMITVA